MRLTIITPTHNRLAFLRENVASVRSSEVHPLDLEVHHLLHDCGSDDGTAGWLSEQVGERLRVLRSPGVMPPGQARNRVIREATGELLMPLDDDDILLQRTAHHFTRALTDPGCQASWAVCDFLRIDHERRYRLADDYYAWRFSTADEMLRAIFSGKHFLQGNVCFRRTLFDQVGGYADDLKTAEDLELYTRFLLADGLPVYVPMVSHLHRMHDDNTSKDVNKDRYNDDMSLIYERHADRLRARGVRLELIP